MNARSFTALLLLANLVSAAGPNSPRDEQATFRLVPGYRIELVASEPEIVDPVAMCFDERGRLFVLEMRGYPNGGVATGAVPAAGRIKLLEDKDGDGVYESSRIFADGLRFPTSVMPCKGGLLVSDAPELVWYDAEGKRKVLYTGFALENIQQLLNGLQWGLDNWIHGSAGNKGGAIRSAERPDSPEVLLRGRGVRLRFDQPGSLEPTSGGGQFGLVADAFGRWFTNTNSQHLRHIVLPEHALKRNPFLAVNSVVLDIPDHGAACKVNRISDFEGWRVERTSRRAAGPDVKRFPSTELVPGGFITSACSPIIVDGNETWICDPANNLIHRDRLEPSGSTFVAKRVDDNCELLASTDNWFRPVSLNLGPDGAVYVLDFYREVIETPLSLPEDMKAKLHLRTNDRGRIWRIRRDSASVARPKFETESDCVAALKSANPWSRLTAQRLLVERHNASAIPELEKLAREGATPESRVHALATLDGLGALKNDLLVGALADSHVGVKIQALRLCEPRVASDQVLKRAVLALAKNTDPQVRLPLAITLGETGDEASAALAQLLREGSDDPWLVTAALSSARGRAAGILQQLLQGTLPSPSVLQRLASLVGAENDPKSLNALLRLVQSAPAESTWPPVLLEGLGQGMKNGSAGLHQLWDKPPSEVAGTVQSIRGIFTEAAKRGDEASLRLLAFSPTELALPHLAEALDSSRAPGIQLAAVKALAIQPGIKPAILLVDRWDLLGPAVRREALEILCSRAERADKLLSAIEAKRISPGQIDSARRDQLLRLPDAKIRARAKALLTVQPSDRDKVIAAYKESVEKPGDAMRGQALFKQHCAVCHRLGDEGHEVGPDLRAVLGTKTRDAFLVAVLDPNREVDPRYVNYQLTTKAGRVVTGILATETASSVTLRRASKEEDTVLRAQIEELSGTAKSLMPEEFEKLLSVQDLADLMAYLLPSMMK